MNITKPKTWPKWLRITSFSVLGVAIVYLIFRDKIDAFYFEKTGALEDENEKVDFKKVLKLGSRGASVAELQKRLVKSGAEIGTTGPKKNGVDGIFGPLTAAALLSIKGVEEIALENWDAKKADPEGATEIVETVATK